MISAKFYLDVNVPGQRTKWRRNIAENFNYLSRAHERYRRQTVRRTDGRYMSLPVRLSVCRL